MKYKKFIRKINGESVEIFEPEKRNLVTEITIAILFLAFIYILANACIAYGVNRERNNKNCIGVEEMENYKETLKIAETICVDIQTQQMGEIKTGYNNSLKIAEEEVKKWKGIYAAKLREVNLTTSTSSVIIKN